MPPEPFYDRYWKEYGAESCSLDSTIPVRLSRLRAALQGLKPGAVVGDVGCGNGMFTAALYSWGYDAHGCDVSGEAIVEARKSHPRGKFSVCKGDEQLPWPDGFCDAIWCSEVLEHIFDIYAFMAEMNRVIKSGGLLLLTTPYHSLVKNLCIILSNFSGHFSPWLSHIRFFDKRSLGDALARGGFRAEKWSGVGRFWPLYKSFFVFARKVGQPLGRPKITG